MFKSSPIPLWVNLLMAMLIAFMGIQIFWFYFDHATLLGYGISIGGAPDLNVIYSTAGRLVAMTAVTIIVLFTQNPHQILVVLGMSILREGQEMLIDPLFPYANAPASPLADFGVHVVIVALEIAAFLSVIKRAKPMDSRARAAQ
ncbi:hypothetical protein [uncultured Tateyamaria sp.]|uniref:hypothetical protein n=1 Tax=uncultured Tateyamaria sp. TaxID=455651 RepID=UPI002615E5D4|nr:hypothetical protein [uncultured Tateyamaria sp.]